MLYTAIVDALTILPFGSLARVDRITRISDTHPVAYLSTVLVGDRPPETAFTHYSLPPCVRAPLLVPCWVVWRGHISANETPLPQAQVFCVYRSQRGESESTHRQLEIADTTCTKPDKLVTGYIPGEIRQQNVGVVYFFRLDRIQ